MNERKSNTTVETIDAQTKPFDTVIEPKIEAALKEFYTGHAEELHKILMATVSDEEWFNIMRLDIAAVTAFDAAWRDGFVFGLMCANRPTP